MPQKVSINANLKFYVIIPSLEEIPQSQVPDIYTKEEWQAELLMHAIYGIEISSQNMEFFTVEKEEEIVPKPCWNYLHCEAEKGSVIIGKSMAPTWWSASLEGKRRACIKVTQGGETFFIDDEDGRGYNKVFLRGGGPDSPHADIPVDDPSTFVLEADGGRSTDRDE